MAENILAVDATSNILKAYLLALEDGAITVISSASEASSVSSFQELLSEILDNVETSSGDAEAQSDKGQNLSEESVATPIQQASMRLRSILAKIDGDWTDSLLAVTSDQYLSLNLNLPFNSESSIKRIIKLEVQDLLPFPVDEFVLVPFVTGPGTNEDYDVHVSMLPRAYLKSIISLCRLAEFEPRCITTPSSLLGALYALAPESMAKNSAAVYSDEQFCYVISRHEGLLRSDRVILKKRSLDVEPRDKDSLIQDLKITLVSLESRYGSNLENIYLLGNTFEPVELQNAIGRPVEKLRFEEFIRNPPDQQPLTALSSIFNSELEQPAEPLANFRSGEFKYNPYIKLIKRLSLKVAPYLLGLVATFCLFLAAKYYANNYYINSMRTALRKEVQAVLPNMEIPSGKELQILQQEYNQLERQLKELGSLAKFSPLDSLLAISRDFKATGDTYVTRLQIESSKIILQGEAPNYQAVEQLERRLRRNKDIYCRVTKTSSGYAIGRRDKRGFKFEITLCQYK
ncbi:MAG: hypothetical protein D6719_03840 [Candidatus Dadabacteria bacterium]|nr:MAG: hypothetical protein D6719_03840 [Candidatus Dadabacteria bacterium]